MIRKLDIGKILSVPFFAMLLIINILGFVQAVTIPAPVTALKVARLTNSLLIISFYFLIVTLFIIRSPVKAKTGSVWANITALVATFMPFLIPFLADCSAGLMTPVLSNAITALGTAFSVYSLSTLGKSFSIIPQARCFVRNGAYKIVRHPVYLGELIAVLGIVIARLSFSTIVVYILFTVLMMYRAQHEEKLLRDVFPDYEAYAKTRSCFIPGVF